MNIAIQLSGLPRFTAEFDRFIDNLTGYEKIDFFIFLWNTWDPYHIDQRVPENWSNDIEEILKKCRQALPSSCSVKKLKVSPPLEGDFTRYRSTLWCNPKQMFSQLYSLKQANQLRLEFENENNIEYDLVIRARPDVGIRNSLNLKDTYDYIKSNPTHIITPKNHRLGMYKPMNDWIAIGTSQTITTYCNLVDFVDHYHDTTTLPFTVETFLAKHLEANHIQWPDTNIEAFFRELCHETRPNPDHGRWR